MKQKTILNLFIGVLSAISILGLSIANKDYYGFTDTRATTAKDCDFYFASENGYTSIFEVNQDLYTDNVKPTYKTWGTVSKISVDASDNYNFYIQSSDASGEISAIYVYRSARRDLSEGNMLTITGSVSLYQNLPEFTNPIIEIDQISNPSPITIYDTNSTFWANGNDKNSKEFLNAQAMGTRKVKITHSLITHLSSGNAELEFDDNTTIPLYYASISNTNLIATKISAVSGSYVDVIGYLHSYISGSTVKLQLLIRDVRDIIGGTQIEDSLTLNSATSFSVDDYDTGNYGASRALGYDFEYYRVTKNMGHFINLLPNLQGPGDLTAPGAFYNLSPIYGITKITVNYYTSLTTGNRPILSYGVTPLEKTSIELELSLTSISKTFLLDEVNYFNFETNESELTLESIQIFYNLNDNGAAFTYMPANSNLFRINPVVYQGIPSNGASISIPWIVSKNGNNYTVEAEKEFTYYTLAYVDDNRELVAEASYTDPIEVAAYYTTFKTWPANYVLKGNYKSAKNIFGDATRCISTYSRKDGYATTVPFNTNTKGEVLYHELDIALDEAYSSSNRGVGRVVCWEYGFDVENYDQAPVCVYTDDHYGTFQEYLNTSEYGTRFNSEMNRTNYIWGPATTLSI